MCCFQREQHPKAPPDKYYFFLLILFFFSFSLFLYLLSFSFPLSLFLSFSLSFFLFFSLSLFLSFSLSLSLSFSPSLPSSLSNLQIGFCNQGRRFDHLWISYSGGYVQVLKRINKRELFLSKEKRLFVSFLLVLFDKYFIGNGYTTNGMEEKLLSPFLSSPCHFFR